MKLQVLQQEFTVNQESLKIWKRIRTLEKQRRRALDKKDISLAMRLTEERKETLRRFI